MIKILVQLKKHLQIFMEGMDNERAMPSYRNEGIVEGRRSSRQPVRTETTEANFYRTCNFY